MFFLSLRPGFEARGDLSADCEESCFGDIAATRCARPSEDISAPKAGSNGRASSAEGEGGSSLDCLCPSLINQEHTGKVEVGVEVAATSAVDEGGCEQPVTGNGFLEREA